MNGLFPRGCLARWIFLRSCGWRGVAFRLSFGFLDTRIRWGCKGFGGLDFLSCWGYRGNNFWGCVMAVRVAGVRVGGVRVGGP